MNSIRLTDEQANDVLVLAKKIEAATARLNLSMRNHASPHTGEEDDYHDAGAMVHPGVAPSMQAGGRSR